MAIEDIQYIAGNNCTTKDNKHVLIKAEPPYYLQCFECGEKFFLISETVMEQLAPEWEVMERPLKRH
jgi:hypothetical protein